MTDETPRTPRPELPPAEEEVRRLLADARHTEPIPDGVAARLDRVLAGLADEPARSAPVVGLAQRRRRATRLLAAAAAVVIGGFVVNDLVTPSNETASDSALAPREAAEGSGADRLDDDTLTEERAQAPQEANGAAGSARTDAARDRRGVLELRSRDFSEQLLDRKGELTAAFQSGYLSDLSAPEAAGRACGSDAWGAGRFVPVTYDGRPAVVVLRRPQGDTQVTDVFLCGDTEPTRTITLPAP